MRRLTLAAALMLVLTGVTNRTALAGTIPGKVSGKIATVPTTPTGGTTAGETGVVNSGTGVVDPSGKFAKVCPKYPEKYAICTATVPAPAFIPPAAPSVLCPAATGTAGTSYSSAIGITEITALSVGFGIIGSLPPGLSLNPASGAITGMPTTTGTYPFTATARDSAGQTGSASCSITVSGAPTPSISYSYSPQTCTQSAPGGSPSVPCQVVTITGTGFPAGQPFLVDLTIDPLITELIISPPPPTGPFAVTGPSFTLANIPVAYCGNPPGIYDQFTISVYAASQPTTPLYTQTVIVPAC